MSSYISPIFAVDFIVFLFKIDWNLFVFRNFLSELKLVLKLGNVAKSIFSDSNNDFISRETIYLFKPIIYIIIIKVDN